MVASGLVAADGSPVILLTRDATLLLENKGLFLRLIVYFPAHPAMPDYNVRVEIGAMKCLKICELKNCVQHSSFLFLLNQARK